MASFPHSRLTPLQSDLLAGFFKRERRYFLTGGGALTGFYFGHRETEDLDLFGVPGLDLREADAAMAEAARACGASVEPVSIYPDFRRLLARRV